MQFYPQGGSGSTGDNDETDGENSRVRTFIIYVLRKLTLIQTPSIGEDSPDANKERFKSFECDLYQLISTTKFYSLKKKKKIFVDLEFS